MNNSRPRLTVALIVILFCAAAYATAPKGWFLAGSKPELYVSGLDPSAPYMDHASAYLKAKSTQVDGFGTLMQEFRANHYLGKRVRFRAFAKSSEAKNWAGLWMRVDKGEKSVAFDNMQDRPILGTTDWQEYAIVLDVPEDASAIFFGLLLNGSGQVWISDAKIEVVGAQVPTTGSARPHEVTYEPVNLDFTE